MTQRGLKPDKVSFAAAMQVWGTGWVWRAQHVVAAVVVDFFSRLALLLHSTTPVSLALRDSRPIADSSRRVRQASRKNPRSCV